MLITPEYYNNEKLYYTQLSFLRLFVKLTPYDIYLLELIRYYLAYFSLYSIQLRDIHCKLNNLNTNILNTTEFKEIKLVDEPDYTYPLFTMKRMMFSHNNKLPYLLEVCEEIQIPSKKWIYFKGNSGTGKTTVIQILLKIIANDYADFFQYRNYDMNAIRKYIILVKSSGDIFQNETVEYNVMFGMDNPPISTIKYYFELFELGNYDEIKDKCADKLSTGEKQRIRVIHTILQVITNKQKRILILDEITSNIDEMTETIIMNELRRLQIEYSLSVIHISHSGGHVRYCDNLMRIVYKNILLTENT
jgi:ABC-type bacteriocin/lantibiotic exporter with double-glycine peptidase domain